MFQQVLFSFFRTDLAWGWFYIIFTQNGSVISTSHSKVAGESVIFWDDIRDKNKSPLLMSDSESDHAPQLLPLSAV